jgi:hypothetical protein
MLDQAVGGAVSRPTGPAWKSCPRFYELDQLIAAEDLVRPIGDPRKHESFPRGSPIG